MSDNDYRIPSIGTRTLALACALFGVFGCSTIDGRHQVQTLEVKVAEREGAPRSPQSELVPTESTAAIETPQTGGVAEPATSVEVALSKSGTYTLSASDAGQSGAAQDGLERTYRVNLGDQSTHPKAMATRYANLQPAACRAEMRRRRIAATVDHGLALGIASPMRLTGPLRQVRFLTPGPKSVHGKLDCRLVLLLDELSGVLSDLGVTSVHVDGFYRPKAHLPGKTSPSQHSFGLAIDIHAFGMDDGRTLLIERDFAGELGTPVCGESAVLQSDTKDAVTLRNIVCAMARAKAFHYLLTPNHDPSHRNHLHGDIKRGARAHVVR